MPTLDTASCEDCDFRSTEYRYFVVIGPQQKIVCQNQDACDRRQKRNDVIAEMQEMAKKPYIHPVDRFNKIALGICAGVLMSIILACVFFLIGL